MRARREGGSVTTEVVLLTPVLLTLLAFVVFAGRVGGVQQQVIAAVDEAARAASLAGTADVAEQQAAQVVEANLDGAGVECSHLTVDVDTTHFRRGGHVAVTATCAIGLGDFAFAGLPGQRTFTASMTEVVDRYRGGD